MEPTSGFEAVRRRLPPQLQQIAELSRPKKLLLAGATLAILAIIIVVLFWNRDPEYRVLFSQLDDRDGGEVVNVLTSMNVPYEVSSDGKAILVPSERVHELRLNLATQGIPKGGSVGFELMDNTRLGTSAFLEQKNYHRALEGELARTIRSLSVVQDAKVHLAIPTETVFIRETQHPTASVVLSMHPGRVLDETQIMGITHLVSSSIPKMPNTAVRIVDQTGKLLNVINDDAAHLGLDGKQLAYVRALEDDLTKRVEKILTPTSGPGNVRAEVSVDIDFSQVEQTEETYKPNSEPNEQAIRSRNSKEAETYQRHEGGVVGAFSNQPPQPPQAPIATDDPPQPATGQPGGAPIPADQIVSTAGTGVPPNAPLERMRESTQNFELDKTITHVKQTPGNNIRRLTAAVIINNKKITNAEGEVTYSPYTEEELTKLTDLVQRAIGYNETRGDSVTVTNIAFDPDSFAQDPSFWEQPDKIELLQSLLGDLLKYLIALMLALYLIFGVIRPLMKPPAPPEEEPLSLAGLGQSPFSLRQRDGDDISLPGEEALLADAAETIEEVEGEDEETLEGHEGWDEEARSSGIEKFLVQKPAYQSDLDFAKELALAEPKIVAKVIRDWMNPS